MNVILFDNGFIDKKNYYYLIKYNKFIKFVEII